MENEIIKQVAEQLEVTVGYVFGVFVEAQVVMGVLHIICMILLAITLYAYSKSIASYLKEGNSSIFRDENEIFIGIGIAIFFAFIIVYKMIIEIPLMEILQPEYSAIKELIAIIR